MARHSEYCKECQCYTCKHDNMHCCSYVHPDKWCNENDCPDYEPEETEGEDDD